MYLTAIQVGKWHYSATLAYQRFLAKQLPEEGAISCPITILLQYFTRENFSFIYQSQNKTFYKLQKNMNNH